MILGENARTLPRGTRANERKKTEAWILHIGSENERKQ